MKTFLVLDVIFLVIFSVACHEAEQKDIPTQGNAKEIKESASLPDDNFIIQGMLEFKENPHTKTWEGYDGLEFFIVDKQGLKFPLIESDSVSHDQLKSFVGNEIEVKVRPYQPPNCSPDSFCGAFPIDKFGNQVRQTIRFKVFGVKKIE